MAALTVQNIAPSGVAPSYSAAAAGGDTIAAGPAGAERCFLHVKNGGGSAITVTINPVSPTSVRTPGVGPLAVPALSVSVPATNGERMIGPFAQAYIDPTTGNVSLSYSAVTSVTVAALALPAVSI